jgi:hypothetical protein
MRSRKFFASYSRNDDGIVSRICDLLRFGGTPLFRDQESIQPGERWQAILEENLQASECVLVFWSVNSASSQAVRDEYERAIGLDKDVAPLLLDDTALPDELGCYERIDFRSLVVVGPAEPDKPTAEPAIDSALGGLVKRFMYSVGAGIGAAVGVLAGAAAIIGVHHVLRALSLEEQAKLADLLAQRIFDKVGGTFADSPSASPSSENDAPEK